MLEWLFGNSRGRSRSKHDQTAPKLIKDGGVKENGNAGSDIQGRRPNSSLKERKEGKRKSVASRKKSRMGKKTEVTFTTGSAGGAKSNTDLDEDVLSRSSNLSTGSGSGMDSIFKLSQDESSFLSREIRTRVAANQGSLPPAPAVYTSQGAVAFVDISGFTSLGETLREQYDARTAASILSSQITFVLKKLTTICLDYGGDVAKFAGDALMCVFEKDNSNDPLQIATACAKSMLMSIRAYNVSSNRDSKIELHGGVSNGALLHVHLSSDDDEIRWYLVAGEAVANATNAAGLSAPGEIVVIDQAISSTAKSPLFAMLDDPSADDQFNQLGSSSSSTGASEGEDKDKVKELREGSTSESNGEHETSVEQSPSTEQRRKKHAESIFESSGGSMRLTFALPGEAAQRTKANSGNPLDVQRKKANEQAGSARGIFGLEGEDALSTRNVGSTVGKPEDSTSPVVRQVVSEMNDKRISVKELDMMADSGVSLVTADTDVDENYGRARLQSVVQHPVLRSGVPSQANAYIPKALRQALRRGVAQAEMRSHVSIVFVGMEDLALTDEELERNDIAEEKLLRLNMAFVELTRVAHAFEGEVRDLLFDDKGCIFIAVFGAHKTIEMPALKALKAAMAMNNEVDRARIGVSIGSCFVGLCGPSKRRHDFVVMGNEVNMAARYMSAAKPGEVFVGPAVKDETSEFIDFTEVRVHFNKSSVLVPAAPTSSSSSSSTKVRMVYRPGRDKARRPSFLAQYRYGRVNKDIFLGRRKELQQIENTLNRLFGSRKSGQSAVHIQGDDEEQDPAVQGYSTGGNPQSQSQSHSQSTSTGPQPLSTKSSARSGLSANSKTGSTLSMTSMNSRASSRKVTRIRKKSMAQPKKTRMMRSKRYGKQNVGVIVVEGEAGMGKTSLASKAKRLSKVRIVTASATANAVDLEASLNVWEQVVCAYLKLNIEEGPEKAHQCIADYEANFDVKLDRNTLKQLLPSLFGISSAQARKSKLRGLLTNGKEQKKVVDLLLKIFKTGPTVGNQRKKNGSLLIIEDMQNLDVDSLCVLKEVFSRLNELHRFVVMVTTRALSLVDEDQDGVLTAKSVQSEVERITQSKSIDPMTLRRELASIVYTFAVRLGANGSGLFLHLSGLDEATSHVLTAKLLGKSNPHMVQQEILNSIYKRTQGFPMFISLLVAWMNENTLTKEDEQGVIVWQGEESVDKTTFPNSIADTVVSRFDALSSEIRNVLKFSSVCGDEISAMQINVISQADPSPEGREFSVDEALTAFKAAFEHGLMVHNKNKSREEKSHIWRWRHDYVREAIKSLLPDSRVAEIEEVIPAASEKLYEEKLNPFMEYFLGATF